MAALMIASAGLGLYGASREAKRQQRLDALMEREKVAARKRGEFRRGQFLRRMSPSVRLAKLGMAQGGKRGRLRAAAMEHSARMKRTQDLLARGGTYGSAAGMQQSGQGDFGTFLQTENVLQQSADQARAGYTQVAGQLAAGESSILGQTDQNLLALSQTQIGVKAGQADPYGAWAAGLGVSLMPTETETGRKIGPTHGKTT